MTLSARGSGAIALDDVERIRSDRTARWVRSQSGGVYFSDGATWIHIRLQHSGIRKIVLGGQHRLGAGLHRISPRSLPQYRRRRLGHRLPGMATTGLRGLAFSIPNLAEVLAAGFPSTAAY